MSYSKDTLKAIAFIRENTRISCEIDRSIRKSDVDCVWDGISLNEGNLAVNPDIAHPGDLLHEAGHIATTPLDHRGLMSGYLEDTDFEFIEADHRLLYASDIAAQGWAILACIAIGFEIRTAFTNGFGVGKSEDLAEAATISTGTRGSNRWMCELYYLGMIEKKSSTVPIAWDIADIATVSRELAHA